MICDLLWNWCNYIGPSLIFATVSIMLLWCVQKLGWKEVVSGVLNKLRNERQWIYRFLFLMYTYFILDRTLLSRHFVWTNGMKHVLTGGWGLYAVDTGEFTYEAVENFMFFIPLIIVYFAAFYKHTSFSKYLKQSLMIGFGLSLFIEMNQLFFKVGEFQVADLVYNTGGALIGGLIYWISKTIKKKLMEGRCSFQ